MIGTPLWWGVQFGLNFLDFLMVYVVAHVAMRQRIEVKPLHVLFCVVYILALAPVFYLWGGHVFRLIAFMCMAILIRIVTKCRYIVDIAIIFAIFSVLNAGASLPIAAFLWLINMQLMLEFPLDFLIGQSILATIVLLMCRKLRLNQWFSAIQRNITLKLVLLIIILMFLVIATILNFEYEAAFLLVSAGAIIAVALPLWPVLMKIYHNAIGMISVHDLKNSLISLGIIMQDMRKLEDLEVLKEHIKRISKDFGVDLSYIIDSEIQLEKELELEDIMTKRVKDFIKEKVRSRGKEVELISEVLYHSDYENVNMGLMLQWLGALLDNAIDASDSKPIYLFVEADAYFLDIRISNEYVGDKGQDIRIILEKGYSTKGEGRGIGLHNLNQQVTEKGGKIKLDDYYEEGHNCHYLQIGVLFEKFQ